MTTHCTLNAIVHPVDGDPDRARVTSQLMVLRNESPVSVASLSCISQHLVREGSHWIIERRSVRSG